MAFIPEVAMTEALGQLNLITTHLRVHNQHEAANVIGKLSIHIVKAFEDGMAHVPPNENALNVKTDGGGHHMMTNHTASRDMMEQQAVMNEVGKGARETATTENGAPRGIQAPNRLPPAKWMRVTTSGSSPHGPSQEMKQLISPMSLTSCSVLKKGQTSDDDDDDDEGGSGVELAIAHSATELPEIPDEKAAIIRIYGKIAKDAIQFVTTRIHEGPLQDIRMETNGRTRATFQHAPHALAFLKSNQEMEALLGYGRFGAGFSVELAEIVDWNDDLHRMNQPIRERRRLSFARKRLFADNMSPDKWKHDIRSLAGPGNIDFLWVFNSGNATAVFTSTIIARKVLDAFNRFKEGRNVYSGVSVTYSSDPCEKELVLIKDHNRPNYHGLGRYMGKRGMR
ncbi:hypothetical protein BDW59DRAFT_181671 [Aspergillus cavernicola]|uniref:Uncharacterized protein n=1 Tax=Aspergillus cavernicola TaxID=176166 RepID=A0ABR4HV55_9EURO